MMKVMEMQYIMSLIYNTIALICNMQCTFEVKSLSSNDIHCRPEQ